MNTEKPRLTLSLKKEKPQGPLIEERIQKVLAQAGLGSRRTIEERVSEGDIRINGVVAEIGASVKAGDRIEVDGKAFIAAATPAEDVQMLMYHKPEGELTTNEDPDGRRTVFERLPRLKGSRWIAIGRLDMNTTGLLLLTTDGELANAMMHPSRELEREYVCRVHGTVTEDMIEKLKSGVMLEDGPAKFDELHVINLGDSHSWFRVSIKEGRNREVRRMWEAVGVEISRLKRIRYGAIELPRELRRGHYRALDQDTVRAMRQELGLQPVPETLTLQAVIGVRRASKTVNEYRPEAKSGSYSGATADEARELRAFDRIDDRRPAGRGKKPPFKKGKRGGPGQPVDPSSFRSYHPGQDTGNRAKPGGNRKPGGGKGKGPRKPKEFVGPMDSNQFANADRRPPGGSRGPGGGGGRGRGRGPRSPMG